jgi:hypothetical protein
MSERYDRRENYAQVAGESPSPGMGLLILLMKVVPPSIEPVYTVVPKATVSRPGLILKVTKLGIQKIPYPDRMTVLGLRL